MLCRIEGKRTAHRDHYYACWAPSGAGPSRSSNVLSDDRNRTHRFAYGLWIMVRPWHFHSCGADFRTRVV